MARPNDRRLFFELAFHLSGGNDDASGKFPEENVSTICRKGIWAPLASFPPLVKTLRDKRFDLVADARVTLGLPEIRVITYVWKGAVDRVAKEKWSAS